MQLISVEYLIHTRHVLVGHWGYSSKQSFPSWSFHQFTFLWGKYTVEKERNRCLIDVCWRNVKQGKVIRMGTQMAVLDKVVGKVTLNSGMHEERRREGCGGLEWW